MIINNGENSKSYFYNQNYEKAIEFFINENNYYGAGLCSLLLKDKKNAKKYWLKSKKNCPACQWGLCVLDFIELKSCNSPSFFQVRAFLEVYLNLFLQNNLIEYAENLISMNEFMYKSNPETYKFIGRALFANGYFDLAITFCKKSLKIFYGDPEAFLILAQCWFLKGNTGEALDCINRCEDIADNYYPTKLFKSIIVAEINKKYKK